MTKTLVLNFSRCSGGAEDHPNPMYPLFRSWETWTPFQNILAKCWKDLTFSTSLCNEAARGTLHLMEEGPRHHELKQNILITITTRRTEANLLPKKSMSKNKGKHLVLFYPSDSVHWKMSFHSSLLLNVFNFWVWRSLKYIQY